MERGIILGSILVLAGFALFLYAFSIWENARFGSLDVEMVTPIVIGSSISFSLGIEVILSSFFLSMLKLNVRTTSAMALNSGDNESERALQGSHKTAADSPRLWKSGGHGSANPF